MTQLRQSTAVGAIDIDQLSDEGQLSELDQSSGGGGLPRRSRRWIWFGRAVFGVSAVSLVAYFAVVGLDKADKLASVIAAVVGLLALVAPYLLPAPSVNEAPVSGVDRVDEPGNARATRGGRANTGVQVAGDAPPAQVVRSGDAFADGPGSVANTGIQRGIQL